MPLDLFFLILELYDVVSGRALGTVDDLELNPRALFQGPEAFGLDGRMMDENIRSVILLDEAKALGIVEPLHRTFFHFHYSFASVRLEPLDRKARARYALRAGSPAAGSQKKTAQSCLSDCADNSLSLNNNQVLHNWVYGSGKRANVNANPAQRWQTWQ